MFVTKNQIFVFIACIAFGFFCGVVFGLLSYIKVFIKHKIIKDILDVILGGVLGCVLVLYAFKLNFPTLRVYMLIGVVIGIVGYFKSFNILLAKSAKKFYNICKSKKVKKKHDRIKIQKAGRRGNCRRSNLINDIDISNDLSVGVNKR